MTRMFLTAGVAALAIAVPAVAGPGGHGDRNQVAAARQGGGGERAAVTRGGGGGAAMRAERVQSFAAPRVQRVEHAAAIERPQRAEHLQMRAERQTVRQERLQQVQTRVAERQQARSARTAQVPTRIAERQQVRAQHQQQAQARVAQVQQLRAQHQQQAQARVAQAQQLRAQHQQQVQAQMAQRQQLRANRTNVPMNVNMQAAANNHGVGYGVGGCPPGLANKAVPCVPPGQAAKLGLTAGAAAGAAAGLVATTPMITAANAAALRTAQVNMINTRLGTRIVAPAVATTLIGNPVTAAPNIIGTTLAPLPTTVSYLYPATPDYYYQYSPGYVYQVDRGTNLIDALIPLLAGGFMPGAYLPQPMMASYVPDYYGLDSFYPASYDYGYGQLCNRYGSGVIYQVDCVTGMVENVIPLYAGGYGVGQMLPSSYDYYNVPQQYRSMYYPTADYSYYYAPGAIYQVDSASSMLTSVAALLSPGFAVGQQLPMGYDVYNVPSPYRSTYYDTADAWYRYNNGYIYQVDPRTMLVTSIVASLLS